MKRILISLFLLSLCGGVTAQTVTLSLEECHAAALEHNRTLKNSRLDLEEATQTRREALTKYFPQVAAMGSVFQAQQGLLQADMNVTLPHIGSLPVPMSLMRRGFMTGITAVQPVFAGLKIVNGNKLARLSQEVGELQIRKSEAEVREKTDAYFWQIVSVKETLKTIEAVERQIDEIYNYVKLAVEAGLVTSNDLLRVEMRRQEVASNRLRAENGLRVSKMLLAQYVGADLHDFDIRTEGFESLPETPDKWYVTLDEALDRRAELQLAEKNVEAHKYQKRMERGKHLPTVGVGAGYLYYNATEKNVSNGVVFASVSVPISGWWGGSHALKKARLKEMQAENDREEAREMLSVEIEKTWCDLQEAYSQILLMQRTVTSATENLRQHRQFYEAGTSTLTDLLDAETLYSQSSNNLTSACAAYHTKLARYMRVTGR